MEFLYRPNTAFFTYIVHIRRNGTHNARGVVPRQLGRGIRDLLWPPEKVNAKRGIYYLGIRIAELSVLP